jgi:hypothetical protein
MSTTIIAIDEWGGDMRLLGGAIAAVAMVMASLTVVAATVGPSRTTTSSVLGVPSDQTVQNQAPLAINPDY